MTACSRLEDYLADRLSKDDVLAFEAHARTCIACGAAVTRRQAVERAAKVMQRNQTARGGANVVSAPRAGVVTEAPAPRSYTAPAAVTVPPQARRVEAPAAAAPVSTLPRWLLLGAVGLAVVGGILFVASRKDAREAEATATAEAQRAEEAAPPAPQLQAIVEAAPTEAPSEGAQPAAQSQTPSEATVPKTQPSADASDARATPKPPAEAAPSPKPQSSAEAVQTPKPQPTAITDSARTATSTTAEDTTSRIPDPGPAGFFPVGTDIEVLAQVVASKRCGMAVAALKARVVSNSADARSWALLTQCYVKRKRWQNAVDAFEMVTTHGNAALIESVRADANRARAALEAEAAAAAAGSAEPAPSAD